MFNLLSIEDDKFRDAARQYIEEFFTNSKQPYEYKVKNPDTNEVFENIISGFQKKQIHACFLDLGLRLPPKLIREANGKVGGIVVLEKILSIDRNIPIFILTATRFEDASKLLAPFETQGITIAYGHKYDRYLREEIIKFLKKTFKS